MWRKLAWGISIHGSPGLLKKQVYWVLISAWPAIGCVPGHGQDSGSRLMVHSSCVQGQLSTGTLRVWEMSTKVPRRPIVTVV